MRILKTLGLRAIAFLAALLGFVSMAAGCAGIGVRTEASTAQGAPMAGQEPLQQTPNGAQSGTLDDTLLDGAELFVQATGYSFLRDAQIALDVQARNHSGSPATVWLLITGINGWNVQDFQQAMTNIALAPGETCTQSIVFDLSDSAAQYLQITSLQQLELTAEGYVDTTNYDYLMQRSTLRMPDVPAGFAQTYAETLPMLVQNAFFEIAYCGREDDSGAITLYYEVKKPAEGARCRLYPIENGIFDTQRYLILDELDMGTATKRLFTFQPAKGGGQVQVTGFYALAEGLPLPPTLLTLPQQQTQQTAANALDNMRIAAQNDWVRIRYDAQGKRFFAENLTQDRVLTVTVSDSFLLDGAQLRANPAEMICFPQTATAFRISGRKVDEKGVERNAAIEQENQRIDVTFAVAALPEAAAEPEELGALIIENFMLQEDKANAD